MPAKADVRHARGDLAVGRASVANGRRQDRDRKLVTIAKSSKFMERTSRVVVNKNQARAVDIAGESAGGDGTGFAPVAETMRLIKIDAPALNPNWFVTISALHQAWRHGFHGGEYQFVPPAALICTAQ